MKEEAVIDLIALLGARLTATGRRFATAESCTGGLIAAWCTDIPGSSVWFEGGVVAYANDVKRDLLGVREGTLAAHGAVSEEVVREMVAGICRITGAQAAVAVSGIAGPDGGTADKPVGTVWIASSLDGVIEAHRFHFAGDRRTIREDTAEAALRWTMERMEDGG